MGTLYVVGIPAGALGDGTRRALRVLGEVALVVAQDPEQTRRFLSHHEIATPLIKTPPLGMVLGTLEAADVALVTEGWRVGLDDFGRQVVCAVRENGLPVVPIPGPNLPITALVVSGLPADSFVYLGELPPAPSVRRKLLSSVSGEWRTLVVLVRKKQDSDDLYLALGERKSVLVTAAGGETKVVWRGTLDQLPEQLSDQSTDVPPVLIVGGARQQVELWEETRLRAEIQSAIESGLGAKEISKQLAAESGWPRREIYRLVVENT